MPDINITVAHKVAVSDTQSIVCDNSDYTVHWALDEEWSAYDTKTMRTIYMDGTFADKVFSGDTIELPVCTVPGAVQIGLFAGNIRTSRVAILRALPSVRSAAGAPADPTPDVYDQLMELIKGMGGASQEDIAKAVADYLASHPVEETDPTVPEWAKAETKPTYSAAEVGAITQADLQVATNAALALAKSSGEFDGATGPAGPQGPAGAPGKDGAGMDITGATVGQIAKITAVDADGVPTAWEPVDMPTGGNGEEMRVIKTIAIIAADVNSIYFNRDDNGLPFALTKRIRIRMYGAATNTGSTQAALFFRAGQTIGDESQAYYPIKVNTHNGNYFFDFVWDLYSFVNCWYGDFASARAGTNNLHRYVPNESNNSFDITVREIKLVWSNASVFFQQGATIVVEGM